MNIEKIRGAIALMAITAERDERHALAAKALAELDKAQQPVAGLTVEEVDQCMDGVGDPPDNPDHFWQWREKFSSRLTAAIEAKQKQ